MSNPGVLSHNEYGKSRVRVVKVNRLADRHEYREINVNVTLYGDFDRAFTHGDNSKVVATDTMKNIVYVVAKRTKVTDNIEAFARALIDLFLSTYAHINKVRISAALSSWERLVIDGQPHHHAFRKGSDELQVTTVTGFRGGKYDVVSGIRNLAVLKTTQSGFEKFVHDQYATLPDVRDRIFGTSITADWRFTSAWPTRCPAEIRSAVRDAMIRAWAGPPRTGVYSPSVQQTLLEMGQAVLAAVPEIQEIRFSLPNIHNIPFNLKPFGMDQGEQVEVFYPTDEPHGTIVGVVSRDSGRSRL